MSVFDGIVPEGDIIGLLMCIGIPLAAFPLVLLAAGYAVSRFFVRKKIEAASARVLQQFPEFIQTREDFRVFAQKVLSDLGWDSVTFTFN